MFGIAEHNFGVKVERPSYLRRKQSMKKTIMTLVATLAMASAAIAADLPSRKTPASPMLTSTDLPTSWYVGVNAGSTAGTGKFTFDGARGVVGGVVGYEVNPFLSLEGDFTDRIDGRHTRGGQMATANAIMQYTVPGTVFTPYALAGAGYGWNAYGDTKGKTAGLWNVGGGVRVALNSNWDLDARYKYVQQFEERGHKLFNENVITTGLNYRF
jgi:outer membrane immunogenic protein